MSALLDDPSDTDGAASIGRRSVGGGILSLGGHGLRLALRVATLVALARLLDPADFGLVAMTWIVTQFGMAFGDLGLATATMQREDIRDEQISTLFWINLVLGGVVTVIVALAAPAVAWYYSEPRLLALTLALAPMAVITSVGLQHQAVLSRQLRHGANAATGLAAAVIAAVAAVIAALCGAGPWTLVLMRLIEQSATAIGVWWVCTWRPGRPSWSDGMPPLLRFGAGLTGVRALEYLLNNVDRLLVGRYFGAPALGIYGQAHQFLSLPLRQFHMPTHRVAVAGLSRLNDDPERFRRYYKNGLLLLASATVPAVAFLAVEAPLLVTVVFGVKWIDMAPILRALAPAALLSSLSPMLQWLWIATGRSGQQLRWMAVRTPLTIIAYVIGLGWGTLGVATALSVAALLLRPIEVPLCLAGTPITFRDLVWAAGRPLLAAAVASGVTLEAHKAVTTAAPVVALTVVGSVFAVTFVTTWVLLPGRRDALSLLRSLPRSFGARER